MDHSTIFVSNNYGVGYLIDNDFNHIIVLGSWWMVFFINLCSGWIVGDIIMLIDYLINIQIVSGTLVAFVIYTFGFPFNDTNKMIVVCTIQISFMVFSFDSLSTYW